MDIENCSRVAAKGCKLHLLHFSANVCVGVMCVWLSQVQLYSGLGLGAELSMLWGHVQRKSLNLHINYTTQLRSAINNSLKDWWLALLSTDCVSLVYIVGKKSANDTKLWYCFFFFFNICNWYTLSGQWGRDYQQKCFYFSYYQQNNSFILYIYIFFAIY